MKLDDRQIGEVALVVFRIYLEPRLRRLKNDRALLQLRQALKANVQKLKNSA